MTSPLARARGRALTGFACAVVLLTGAGCTGGGDEGAPAASPLPSASTGAAATLEAKPVPLDVKVAQVVGRKMRPGQRKLVEQQVGRTVSRYFDAAFLGGEYPRSGFQDAFDTFSSGAARRARGDRALLTNAALGGSTVAVVPRRRWVRLSVLLPRRVVAGVTARVRLVFLADREGAADEVVTVNGRLLLSRARSGRWEIFGYDLARSSVPAEKGGQ